MIKFYFLYRKIFCIYVCCGTYISKFFLLWICNILICSLFLLIFSYNLVMTLCKWKYRVYTWIMLENNIHEAQGTYNP